jgi:hypothetical protein
MSDPVRARERLIEACVGQGLMNSGEASRLHSQVDDDVDIVGRSGVEQSSFDLVQEDHLSTDEKAVITQCWCQLDEGAP